MKKRWNLIVLGAVFIFLFAGCETLTEAGAGVKVYKSLSEVPNNCQLNGLVRSYSMFEDTTCRIRNNAGDKLNSHAVVVTAGPLSTDYRGFLTGLVSTEYTANAYVCK